MAGAFPTPLTTTFTPPAECLSQLYWFSGFHIDVGPGTQCIPSGPAPSLRQSFSPGLYCPSGWTVACQSTNVVGTMTETRATCCPKLDKLAGYSGLSMTCNSDSTGHTWWSTLGCAATYGSLATKIGSVSAIDLNAASISTTTIPVLAPDGLNAYSVQLAWQASDLISRPTTTSIPTSSATIQQSSSSSSSSSGSAAPATGLSTSAKIAIGVTIPVVVIGLLIGLGFFIAKKRRARNYTYESTSQNMAHDTTTQTAMSHKNKPELYNSGAYDSPRHELPHQEVAYGKTPFEQHSIPELPGSQTHGGR